MKENDGKKSFDHDKVVITNCWHKNILQEEVIDFWEQLAAGKNKDYTERAKQLVQVALLDNQIIGVTTAHEVKIPSINNLPFFNYRILLHPEFRAPGLVEKLGVASIHFLEGLFKSQQTDCIGMITLVENDLYKKHRRQAIWPTTGFVYMGNSKAGHPIRVRYFEGAEV